MSEKIARVFIQGLGIIALLVAIQIFFWWRKFDPQTTPTGYMFGITLIPLHILLAVGLLARRFWAGIAGFALLLFGVSDWFLSSRSKTDLVDWLFVGLLFLSGFLLWNYPTAWIRRF